MRLQCLLLAACMIILQAVRSQNLVANGSFEDYSKCPGSFSEHPAEFRATAWRSISLGSPDYFNTCSRGEADVPYNWAGVSDPFDGNAYAGIFTWMAQREYREYLHCTLTEPLIRDTTYIISFRYKLSTYSRYATDRIGILLSDSIERFHDDGPLPVAPSFEIVKDSALTPETGSWELALTEYRAEGHERFLTLGNFSGDETRRYFIRHRPGAEPMLAEAAYYYIDDVKVIPKYALADLRGQPVALGEDDPELNTVYVLDNIQFEFDSYTLLPVSYRELDGVVEYLKRNPGVSVRLSGHTDDVGEYEYNFRLSDARARSVASYLTGNGIDPARIRALGFGESKPLVEGTTEEARRTNRRVEIEFR